VNGSWKGFQSGAVLSIIIHNKQIAIDQSPQFRFLTIINDGHLQGLPWFRSGKIKIFLFPCFQHCTWKETGVLCLSGVHSECKGTSIAPSTCPAERTIINTHQQSCFEHSYGTYPQRLIVCKQTKPLLSQTDEPDNIRHSVSHYLHTEFHYLWTLCMKDGLISKSAMQMAPSLDCV